MANVLTSLGVKFYIGASGSAVSNWTMESGGISRFRRNTGDKFYFWKYGTDIGLSDYWYRTRFADIFPL